MAVPKGRRKESQFEVIKHFYRMRSDLTDLILRDFGYSSKKFEDKITKIFGGRSFEELAKDQKTNHLKTIHRHTGFEEWFIAYQRNVIMGCLEKSSEYIFTANSIYPSMHEELVERRVFQDKAIGQLYRLLQELTYTIEILPVDVDKYVTHVENIEREIALLKGWRKSDNKFKKQFIKK